MRKKEEYKSAIQLRKEGKTYNEILERIPVAKSTLSLWLRSIGMATPQQQRITKKRIEAQRRGALSRRTARVNEVERLLHEGEKEVKNITTRELWLIGTALYWAEGSKQNMSSVSTQVQFGNSDVRMIKVFLMWLSVLGVPQNDLHYELYIHDNRKDDVKAFCRWWERELHLQNGQISTVYFKRDKPLTKRTNIGDLYHGLLRIRVRTSTILNRKISGWIAGIVQHCQIV